MKGDTNSRWKTEQEEGTKKGSHFWRSPGSVKEWGFMERGARLSKGAQESCRRKVSVKGGGTQCEGGWGAGNPGGKAVRRGCVPVRVSEEGAQGGDGSSVNGRGEGCPARVHES